MMIDADFSELNAVLHNQLKPYGYCGHLLKFIESKKSHLEDMIKRTALMSESNSLLIIGPKGSGKSSLLECAVQNVFKNDLVKENMFYVELDGLIHINDNLALEDITRQLKMKEFDDKTLGSFSEKLRILLSFLKSGNKKSKSVLFVLDNFDLFCGHKNQTLLYNLFDVAQSQQSPICVIGMSCRPDVLQILENRVNSRFSHQMILLFEDMTLKEYTEAAKDLLLLHNFQNAHFQKHWNSNVNDIFQDASTKKILERRFNCSNTFRDLKELLYLAVQNIGYEHPKLTVEDFQRAFEHCNEDSIAMMMQGLSVLELSLVISMMHLNEIYDGEPFNFEIAFNMLEKLFRKMAWNVEKAIVMKAFEHLLELELIRPCTGTVAKLLKQFMLVRLLVNTEQIKEAVENYSNLPIQIKHWCESNIN